MGPPPFQANATNSTSSFQASPEEFTFIDCTSKYYPPQKRKKGERKTIHIHATRASSAGHVDTKKEAERRSIRAQAARASSATRIETIRRRAAERTGWEIVSPTSLSESDVVGCQFSELFITQDLSPSPGPEKWDYSLHRILRDASDQAVQSLQSMPNGCNVQFLADHFLERSLYDHELILDCLSLLVATDFSVTELDKDQPREQLSRPVIVQLRHQLLVSLQSAVHGGLPRASDNPELPAVLFLLGGWEWKHGEPRSCEFHLRALWALLGKCESEDEPCTISIPLEAPFFHPTSVAELPPGFEHYKVRGLLPACLMEAVGSFNPKAPKYKFAKINLRRMALMALSCQPADPADQSLGIQATIATHVKLAAVMLSVMMQVEFDEEAESVLGAWYLESLNLQYNTLPGTAYDEILVWCWCIFCASSTSASSQQIEALADVVRFQELDVKAILHRYVCPDVLLNRLEHVLPALFDK